MDDLRLIQAQLGILPHRGATDFQIHSEFVVCATSAGLVATALQDRLEQRYGEAIRRFAAAKDAARLAALWAICVEEGDIPGPYWAVMTHPVTDAPLCRRAFGEVHMRSSLAAAGSRRQDQARRW